MNRLKFVLDYNKLDENNTNEFVEYIGATTSRLAKQAYDIYAQEIDFIINSKAINVKDIEKILDSLLGFCYDSNILKLFKTLCRYYYYIDKQAVAEYIEFYREMWDSDDE